MQSLLKRIHSTANSELQCSLCPHYAPASQGGHQLGSSCSNLCVCHPRFVSVLHSISGAQHKVWHTTENQYLFAELNGAPWLCCSAYFMWASTTCQASSPKEDRIPAVIYCKGEKQVCKRRTYMKKRVWLLPKVIVWKKIIILPFLINLIGLFKLYKWFPVAHDQPISEQS